MSLNYYVLDTETTGLKAGFHEINQISIIRCSDRFQKTVNIRVENPGRASPEALQIQNKTKYDLKFGIEKDEAIEIVDLFLEEDEKTNSHRCIIGHNVSFDRRFLHAMWDSSHMKFKADLWMCTKEFTRKLAKKQGLVKPKLALASAMNIAGLTPKDGAHNAVIDTINTHELWKKLMEEKLNYVSLIKNAPHEDK